MTAAAQPSSTVLLLRDGAAGLEVLMVQRHHAIDFASGALVFPGGKLAKGDRDPGLPKYCRAAPRLSDDLLTLGVAAIREAFEESGLLLARPNGSEDLVTPERLVTLDGWRPRLTSDEAGMASFGESEKLEFALDLLVPFAHWITPTVMPKRFDTWFFLAPAPAAQLANHDGRESVDSRWVSPGDLLAESDAGRATVVFATRMNLKKLAESKTVAEAFAAAQHRPVPTVMPEVDPSAPGGGVLRIPAEAGYGVTEIPLSRVMR